MMRPTDNICKSLLLKISDNSGAHKSPVPCYIYFCLTYSSFPPFFIRYAAHEIPATSRRSASIIIETSPRKSTFLFQLLFFLPLLHFPTKLYLCRTVKLRIDIHEKLSALHVISFLANAFASQRMLMPSSANAASTNWRTVCVSFVASIIIAGRLLLKHQPHAST